jgi:hypothetical protein
MRRFPYFVLTLFLAAIVWGFLPIATQVDAQVGGGHVHGYVFSFDQYDQLVPVGWADIVATNEAQTFTAYSGENGFYEMMLPTGTFTLSVSEPGYKDYSATIAVSNGSSTAFDVYMERSETPIPEFSGYLAAVVVIAAFASVIVLTRRFRKTTR